MLGLVVLVNRVFGGLVGFGEGTAGSGVGVSGFGFRVSGFGRYDGLPLRRRRRPNICCPNYTDDGPTPLRL